jgi:4-diphosphocytidyl-2-C-methyl-D-erythritol kinase
MPFKVNAFAKINLFLNLLGLRPEGFHDVRFLMQTVDLADVLDITVVGPGLQIDFTCSLPELSGTDNLVVEAYQAFYRHVSQEPQALKVFLQKNIPVQAGLGGGSSDAAAMLMTLNQIHHGVLCQEDLMTLAAQLGSDVPFFMVGGTCLASGRGEKIVPLPSLPAYELLIVKPTGFGIPTPLAYEMVRKAGNYQELDFSLWQNFLEAVKKLEILPTSLLQNDFEAPIFASYPQLAIAKQQLSAFGDVLLSGSGPSLFVLLKAPSAIYQAQIEALFPPSDWTLLSCRFQDSNRASNVFSSAKPWV